MKKNRKFIYLLSPNKLKNELFFTDLKRVFSTNKISFFQLRIKDENSTKIFKIAKKVKKICKQFNVKLIINDSPDIAKKLKLMDVIWDRGI